MVTLQRLEKVLRNHKRIALDSNILIYFIEANPQYYKLTQKIFQSIEAGKNLGICSTLTLLEILVQPYRTENDELVNQFYGLLTTYPNISWVPLSTEIADTGARFRAQYKLKTPDAILAATGFHSGATCFIGNDTQLKRIREMDILILSYS